MTAPTEEITLMDAPLQTQNEWGGDAEWGDAPEVAGLEDRGDLLDAPETAEADETAAADDATEVAGTPGDAPAEEEPEHDGPDGEPDADERPDEPDGGEADEPEEPGETEAAPARKKVTGKVPRARLNKEIEKRRALEAEVAELRARAADPAPAAEPEAPAVNAEAFKAMSEALLDGDTETAMAKFAEMTRQGAPAVDEADLEAKIEARIEAKAQQKALKAAADEMIERYPVLDHTSDEADQGLIEEVVDLREMYINRGNNPADALKKAVKMIAFENDLDEAAGDNPLAEPAKAVSKKPVDVQKKVAVAKKAAPKLGGSGAKNREVKLDLMKLSDDEFARVSAEQLARARGDIA